MGKRSPSPPPPPDPSIAIDAQADANRYNTTTPYGNTTWTESDDGKWTQDFSFSPEAQNLFNRSLGILDRSSNGFGQQPSSGVGNWISNERNLNNPGALPIMSPGQPDSVNVISPGNPDGLLATTPGARHTEYRPELVQLGDLQEGGLVPGSSQAINAPQDADYSGIYDNYGNAVNERSSYLINKGFDPQIKSFQQEMANRGIPEGSEAYNDLYRSRIGDPMSQAYDSAAFKSIATGEAMRTQDYNMMSNLWGRGQVAPAMPIDAMTPHSNYQSALNSNYALEMQQRNAQLAAIGKIGAAAIPFGGGAASAGGGTMGGGKK